VRSKDARTVREPACGSYLQYVQYADVTVVLSSLNQNQRKENVVRLDTLNTVLVRGYKPTAKCYGYTTCKGHTGCDI
jgi:hypothetical protein